MDETTFGDAPAALTLTKILNENKSCSRQVTRMLSKQVTGLNAISKTPDKGTRETILLIWHARFKRLVERSGFPLVVCTHLLNVETGLYRQLLKESNEGSTAA